MINWKGLKNYQSKLKRAPREFRQKTKQDLERWGRGVVFKAVEKAPVDLGKLRQSISYESIKGGMGARVSVGVPYGAIQEFGSGAAVVIPEGWQAEAEKWKGTKGRKVTITPQPYFIPAIKTETERLKARLRYNLKNFAK